MLDIGTNLCYTIGDERYYFNQPPTGRKESTMTKVSTIEIMEQYELFDMYDILSKWIEVNGYTIANLPLTAENEDGEPVIIEARDFGEGPVFMVSTAQENGWMRINYYHADGTVEETYKR